MAPYDSFPIRKFEDGRLVSASDRVITEMRVELDIGGMVKVGMLCLPQQLEALAIGFLLGEGILRSEDVESVEVSIDGQEIHLRGDFDADAAEAIHRRWTWGTGCGGGGTSRDLDSGAFAPVGAGPTMDAERLWQLSREFHGRTSLWRDTGGVHACALADAEGILLFAEDIGRHNAFDKIMGVAAMDGIDVGDKLMLATGRLTAEIVSKAVACGAPMLASRAAVTSLAIGAARRFGVTLVGFLRNRRMNVYTGYQRVICASQ